MEHQDIPMDHGKHPRSTIPRPADHPYSVKDYPHKIAEAGRPRQIGQRATPVQPGVNYPNSQPLLRNRLKISEKREFCAQTPAQTLQITRKRARCAPVHREADARDFAPSSYRAAPPRVTTHCSKPESQPADRVTSAVPRRPGRLATHPPRPEPSGCALGPPHPTLRRKAASGCPTPPNDYAAAKHAADRGPPLKEQKVTHR